MRLSINKIDTRGLQFFFFGCIAVSAALILLPDLRAYPASKVLIGAIVCVLFVVRLIRGLRDRTITKTVPELFAEAKSGRKFSSALEKACTVAVLIAFWMTILTTSK